jgi:glucose/arabinose dehydrogenase
VVSRQQSAAFHETAADNTEGEAAADTANVAFAAAGLDHIWLATTSPGGSKNWQDRFTGRNLRFARLGQRRALERLEEKMIAKARDQGDLSVARRVTASPEALLGVEFTAWVRPKRVLKSVDQENLVRAHASVTCPKCMEAKATICGT